ncbi:MAG: SDR family oxidoreductase [Acidobacteria bacterium]|nr:SDR family oxidoreductase [Acidobacteriota bacterium]
MDFSNRVVVITGAAGSLGSALTRSFQGAGAKLALVDRSKDRLGQLFPDIAASPDHFFTPPTDLTDEDSVALMVEATHHHFKRIDVLINTAGGYRAGSPLQETTVHDWDLMLNINARSVFLTCRAVIPHMLQQNSGKIVNLGSRAAIDAGANQGAYSASKSAVLRLTESMAAELKETGINVNCVLPGIIDTPENRAAMPQGLFSKWVTTQDLANVILFLSSDAARAIHGAAIPVYGRS